MVSLRFTIEKDVINTVTVQHVIVIDLTSLYTKK